MIQWIIIVLLVIIAITLYYMNHPSPPKEMKRLAKWIADKPDWLVQAEKDYGLPMTYPQASNELATFGYPQSQIDESQVVIQSNLEQIKKDNLQSLEEKKNDPSLDPPKYGVTIASIYSPEEFLSKNTGLKMFVPPPQSGMQPVQPSSYGTVITPDKTKILPDLNYGILGNNVKLPVYNQNQCGCCWAISCTAVLNYHLFDKEKNALERIAFPNQYTFCVQPNTPNGFSRQSNGCRGGIPTDVFIDINDSKKLSTVQNQPQNLSFNQNNNKCNQNTGGDGTNNGGGGNSGSSGSSQQQSGNPVLNVQTLPFPTKGVIALFEDGKFYLKETVDNPATFLPTSQLRSYR